MNKCFAGPECGNFLFVKGSLIESTLEDKISHTTNAEHFQAQRFRHVRCLHGEDEVTGEEREGFLEEFGKVLISD